MWGLLAFRLGFRRVGEVAGGPFAVTTAAVCLGAELAQQVSLEHKKLEGIRRSFRVVHGSSSKYGLQAISGKIS